MPSAYATHYLKMSGYCTSLLAERILADLSPPITSSATILDAASGPGVVSALIRASHPSVSITVSDISPDMLEEVSISDPGAKTIQADIRSMSVLPTASFSHVIANLALPIPGEEDGGIRQVLSELKRLLKDDGVLMLTTWADRVWPMAFERVARTVRPEQEPVNRMRLERRFLGAGWLAEGLEEVFGRDVQVKSERTWTKAGSMEELVGNMFFAKDMFFAGYDEAELEKVKVELGKEIRKLRKFEQNEEGVRIGMWAWVGVAWKKEGQNEEAVC